MIDCGPLVFKSDLVKWSGKDLQVGFFVCCFTCSPAPDPQCWNALLEESWNSLFVFQFFQRQIVSFRFGFVIELYLGSSLCMKGIDFRLLPSGIGPQIVLSQPKDFQTIKNTFLRTAGKRTAYVWIRTKNKGGTNARMASFAPQSPFGPVEKISDCRTAN